MNGSSTVSVTEINEAVSQLRNFISHMDNEMGTILQTLASLETQGILSSAQVNEITREIRAKIQTLNENFNTMIAEFTTGMTTSAETIQTAQRNIESNLESNL